MNPTDFAARLAASLRREGLTLLVGDTPGDEILDQLEAMLTSHHCPLAVYLSDTGRTVHFALLTEDPRQFAHHNAFLNNKVGLLKFAQAKAAGRKTRILRPGP